MNIARVPGTCGELAQGMLDDTYFLVSCPINLYSYISIEINRIPGSLVCPADKPKARAAAQKILERLKRDSGIKIEISSEIPVGKGMASSTADIVGVCLGVAQALGHYITAREVAKIALSIEPTDGTAFSGITLFDHREGTLFEYLGEPPDMKILTVDLGGHVDTIEFNHYDFSPIYRMNQHKISEALDLIKRGIKDKDPHCVGEGATLSALCNQTILPKPALNEILSLSKLFGAYGVNVAHSGTVIGILLHPQFDGIASLKHKVKTTLNKTLRFYETNLISGGGEFLESISRRRCQGSIN